jgi:hypothetical protein
MPDPPAVKRLVRVRWSRSGLGMRGGIGVEAETQDLVAKGWPDLKRRSKMISGTRYLALTVGTDALRQIAINAHREPRGEFKITSPSSLAVGTIRNRRTHRPSRSGART